MQKKILSFLQQHRGAFKTKELARALHLAKQGDEYQELKAALRELPLEKLDEAVLYAWGPTGSVERLIEVFVHHEGIEHADELRAWKVRQG